MKKLICDGCGMGELIDYPKHKITTVELRPITNSHVDPIIPFKADLCSDCQGLLLHKYFNVPARGGLEVPAFLEPTDKERAVRLAT